MTVYILQRSVLTQYILILIEHTSPTFKYNILTIRSGIARQRKHNLGSITFENPSGLEAIDCGQPGLSEGQKRRRAI